MILFLILKCPNIQKSVVLAWVLVDYKCIREASTKVHSLEATYVVKRWIILVSLLKNAWIA